MLTLFTSVIGKIGVYIYLDLCEQFRMPFLCEMKLYAIHCCLILHSNCLQLLVLIIFITNWKYPRYRVFWLVSGISQYGITGILLHCLTKYQKISCISIKFLVLFLPLHCDTWYYRVCGWNSETLMSFKNSY